MRDLDGIRPGRSRSRKVVPDVRNGALVLAAAEVCVSGFWYGGFDLSRVFVIFLRQFAECTRFH